MPAFAQDGGAQTEVGADGGAPANAGAAVNTGAPASDGVQKGDDAVTAAPPADSPPTVNRTEAASPPTGEVEPDEGPPVGVRKISDKGLIGDAPAALPAAADAASDDATADGAGGDAVAADADGVEVAAAIPVADKKPHDQPGGVAAHLANWVSATHDNGKRPFAIIDKLGARMFVFAPDGTLLGAAPVLVGLARGDDSQAGIGEKALAAISPKERTTPAGRFVARFGPAAGEHKTVLWVDYGDDIALHPVITTNPKEHRLKRIKSAAAADHRISFGCINVPATFYDKVVLTAFRKHGGIVYILPDTRPVQEIFPAFGASLGAVDAGDQSGDAATARADAQGADPLAVDPMANDPLAENPPPAAGDPAPVADPDQPVATQVATHPAADGAKHSRHGGKRHAHRTTATPA
ncbi:MAG TPA: hypothetical protein VN694_12620 [Caulobacteraceae bacterium]|nr:hypothetical protein [Caulobacteraceae bacterium]